MPYRMTGRTFAALAFLTALCLSLLPGAPALADGYSPASELMVGEVRLKQRSAA